MAMICDNCGKKTVTGVHQRHKRGVAGKRWKNRSQATLRTFKPNLQAATVVVSGVPTQLRLCTRCIKKFRSQGQLARQQTRTVGIHA